MFAFTSTIVSNTTVAWLFILISGLFEVLFSVSMKYSDGFTKLFPSVVSIVAAVLSVWLMSLTLKLIPVGTAYAVWAGIGVTGTAILGIILFQEPLTFARAGCMALVIAGIVGLQLQSPA